MGQGCTKSSQQAVTNGAYNAPEPAPSAVTRSKSADVDGEVPVDSEQQLPPQRARSQVWQSTYGLGGRYALGVRSQVQHPIITRGISSLTAQELNNILAVFRTQCLTERTSIQYRQSLSKALAAKQQALSAGVRMNFGLSSLNQQAASSSAPVVMWKRISLTESALYELFPSVHDLTICSALEALHSTLSKDAASAVDGSGWSHMEIITPQQLLQCFQLISFYCPSRSDDGKASNTASKETSKNICSILYEEVIVEDFSFIIATCLHGSQEEMLLVLFLLFAEQLPSASATAPLATRLLPSGRGSAALASMGLTQLGAMKLHLFVQLRLFCGYSSFLNTTSSHFDIARGTINNLRSGMESSTAQQLSSMILKLADRIDSYTIDAKNTLENCLNFDDFYELFEEPSDVQLTADMFQQRVQKLNDSPVAAVVAELNGLRLHTSNLRLALVCFPQDVLPSFYATLREIEEFFISSETQSLLLHCLRFLKEDMANTPCPTTDFEVMLLDAKWWATFCRCVDIEAVYLNDCPSLQHMVMGLQKSTTSHHSNAKHDAEIIVGTSTVPIPILNNFAVQSQASFPVLRNAKLLEKDEVGVLQTAGKDLILPFDAGADSKQRKHNTVTASHRDEESNGVTSMNNSSNGKKAASSVRYVVLPYSVGALLYRRFDIQANVIPAGVYRRRLRFASTLRPISPSESPGNDYHVAFGSSNLLQRNQFMTGRSSVNSKSITRIGYNFTTDTTSAPPVSAATMASTVDRFVNNFYASNYAYLEVQPLFIPIFWCCRSGLATVAPVHVISMPTDRGGTLLDVLQHTLQQLLGLTPTQCTVNAMMDKFRVWGRFSILNEQQSSDGFHVEMQHTKDSVWRLLTGRSSEYYTGLDDLFLDSSRDDAKSRGNYNIFVGGASSGSEEFISTFAASPTKLSIKKMDSPRCNGLMIESLCLSPPQSKTSGGNGSPFWPSSIVLAGNDYSAKYAAYSVAVAPTPEGSADTHGHQSISVHGNWDGSPTVDYNQYHFPSNNVGDIQLTTSLPGLQIVSPGREHSIESLQSSNWAKSAGDVSYNSEANRRSKNDDECTYRIGQRVSVLNDANCWVTGEIAAIDHTKLTEFSESITYVDINMNVGRAASAKADGFDEDGGTEVIRRLRLRADSLRILLDMKKSASASASAISIVESMLYKTFVDELAVGGSKSVESGITAPMNSSTVTTTEAVTPDILDAKQLSEDMVARGASLKSHQSSTNGKQRPVAGVSRGTVIPLLPNEPTADRNDDATEDPMGIRGPATTSNNHQGQHSNANVQDVITAPFLKSHEWHSLCHVVGNSAANSNLDQKMQMRLLYLLLLSNMIHTIGTPERVNEGAFIQVPQRTAKVQSFENNSSSERQFPVVLLDDVFVGYEDVYASYFEEDNLHVTAHSGTDQSQEASYTSRTGQSLSAVNSETGALNGPVEALRVDTVTPSGGTNMFSTACNFFSKAVSTPKASQGIKTKNSNSSFDTSQRFQQASARSNITDRSNHLSTANEETSGGTVGVVGLNNLGNTCFLSAALQCLLRTPPFVLYFLTNQYKLDVNARSNLGTKGRISEAFAQFLSTVYSLSRNKAFQGTSLNNAGTTQRSAISFGNRSNNFSIQSGGNLNSSGSYLGSSQHSNFSSKGVHQQGSRSSQHVAISCESLSPTTFLKLFQSHKPQFHGADQQDSQEFLCELLDTFHEDLKVMPVAQMIEQSPQEETTTEQSSDGNSNDAMQEGENRWKKYMDHNTSVVSNLFQGQMCSKIVCNVCNNSSSTFEPFTTLSMPIPKQRSTGVNGSSSGNDSFQSETINLMITVHRKMPRLSQLLCLRRVPAESTDGQKGPEVTPELLQALHRSCRQPTRLAITISRYATLDEVRQKAVQIVNELDSKQQMNDDEAISNSSSSKKRSKGSTRKRPVLPVLLPQHTIIMDAPSSATSAINGNNSTDAGFRFSKPLDRKETIMSLFDDAITDYCLVLLERNKDIPFIGTLQTPRLAMDYSNYLQQLYHSATDGGTVAPPAPRIPQDSIGMLEYLDEYEYDAMHPLYNDSYEFEGRVVADLDHTYDPKSYKRQAVAGHSNSRSGRSSSRRERELQDQEDSSSSDVEWYDTADFRYSNRKAWPKSISGFQIGDRVDCLDYKGSWFAGSVMDIWHITAADITAGKLERYSRAYLTSSRSSNGTSKVPVVAGVHMRVHFDNYSNTWDEWFDEDDLRNGYVAPVFQHSQRKLKIHELPVVHRKLIYKVGKGSDDSAAENGSSGDSLQVELTEHSYHLQCECYRTLAHCHAHIQEQALRFVNEETLMHLLGATRGSKNTADSSTNARAAAAGDFAIRILSLNNLLAPPTDQYVIVNNAFAFDKRSARSTHQQVRVATYRQQHEQQSQHFDAERRFYGHKLWEGTIFPADVCRPTINIFHNKLAVAIDWLVQVPGEVAATVETHPLDLMMRNPFTYRDDNTYDRFMKEWNEKQAIAAAAAQRNAQEHEAEIKRQRRRKRDEKKQLQIHEQLRALTLSDLATVPQANKTAAEQYEGDVRAGLTIEDVISKFVGSEDIEEYFCNKCNRLTPGRMHTSIHTLPDFLILHLQRLVMNATGGGKIRTLVKFPLNDLNMNPFTTAVMEQRISASHADDGADAEVKPDAAVASIGSDCGEDVYELYGVVNHLGGMYGGHYTAFARCEDIEPSNVPINTAPPASKIRTNNVPLHMRSPHPLRSSLQLLDPRMQLHTDRLIGPVALPADGSSLETTADDETDSITSLDSNAAGDAVTAPSISGEDSNTLRCSTAASSQILSLSDYVVTTAEDETAKQLAAEGNGAVKKWLKFDDDFVTLVSNSTMDTTIVSESAYLLFYQRKQVKANVMTKYL